MKSYRNVMFLLELLLEPFNDTSKKAHNRKIVFSRREQAVLLRNSNSRQQHINTSEIKRVCAMWPFILCLLLKKLGHATFTLSEHPLRCEPIPFTLKQVSLLRTNTHKKFDRWKYLISKDNCSLQMIDN